MVPIRVALLPHLAPAERDERGVCIVIDVLRATTTLTTLLDRGATLVSIAPDVAAARRAKERDPGALLIGEIGGERPPGFDLGNSPLEITDVVAGRRAICHTSNGTAAIRAVGGARAVLLGCLRNATAVTRLACARAAAAGAPITVVCSGGGGGRNFALDDTLAAGELVRCLLVAAGELALAPSLDDAAVAALTLRETLVGPDPDAPPGRWLAALRSSTAGRHLEQIGLGADIPFCAQPDQTTCVPEARVASDQVLVTRALSPDAAGEARG